jgi:transposase
MEKRFVASLTESEQQTLASAYQHGEQRALCRWAHAILLSDQGHTINQISEILQVRCDTVSRRFKQWEVSGLDGLIDKPLSGRTPALDDHDHQRLQALVAEHLHQIRALQARFQEATGMSVATMTIRRALKKMAIVSSAFGTHSRPSGTKRTRNTQGLMKALHEQEDQAEHELYYFDESGFSQASSMPV